MPVVLIQDGAIDEYMSMAILATDPSVDLRGVIIVNADCIAVPAMDAAARILEYLGCTHVPVGLSGSRFYNPFPWNYRSDCVRLNGIDVLGPFRRPASWPPFPDGDELLSRLLRTSAEPLELLVTSPLTPLVDVVRREPVLARNINRLTWMGGAMAVAGNLDPATVPEPAWNAHAEWNAFCDPYAVNWWLVSTDVPTTIYPLDVTNRAKVARTFTAQLGRAAQSGSRAASLAYSAYELTKGEEFYELWDVTTTCGLLSPEIFSSPQRAYVEIETALLGEQGALRVRPNSAARQVDIVVDLAVPLDAFYAHVVELLSRI